MRMLPPVRRKTIAAPSIVIALLTLAWPASVLADCVDTRPPTAAEKDFHSRAMAAIVAALPPVPVGGKLQNKDSMPTLGQQCAGTQLDPAARHIGRPEGCLRPSQPQTQCGVESDQCDMERQRQRFAATPGTGRCDRPHTAAVTGRQTPAFRRGVSGTGGTGLARHGRRYGSCGCNSRNRFAGRGTNCDRRPIGTRNHQPTSRRRSRQGHG
jgi:hypothetical protein